MADAVIAIDNVTKLYGGSVGVKDITLHVSKGSIFGFLGPNGAGKTTTISMLIDLIRPTSGQIQIFGQNNKEHAVDSRQRIGFLAGDFALDKDLTGWQQLEYFGALHGSFDKAYVTDLADRLDCNLTKKFKELSRGNRQKVGLISALMHQPELLIFDEPTSGLDPLIQAEFNKIIGEHKARGGTAFISSHALGEVQALCDEVAFIRAGELVAVRSMKELSDAATKYIRLVTEDKKLIEALTKLPGVKLLARDPAYSEFTAVGDINQVLAVLGKGKVNDLIITEADLEAIFMGYYQEAQPDV